MKKLQILFLFVSFLFLIPSVSAMENVLPGKDINGFSVQIKGDSYNLQYRGKTVVSRKGTLKNWEKYSFKESWDQDSDYQCGNDDYYKLGDFLKKEDEQKCLKGLMSQIYSVSKNTGRYYIIGVGERYYDWSSGYFFETYIFDTKTRRLLQLEKFSEYSEAPPVKILEGKSGIYILTKNVLIISKELTKITSFITIFNSKEGTCGNYFNDSSVIPICIDLSNNSPVDSFGEYIDSIELLENRKIKIHIIYYDGKTEAQVKIVKIISL